MKDDPDEIIQLADGICLYVKGEYSLSFAEREFHVPADLVIRGALWVTNLISPGVRGYHRETQSYIEL